MRKKLPKEKLEQLPSHIRELVEQQLEKAEKKVNKK